MDATDGDAKALAHIGMTLTEQHLPTFMECETDTKAAWDAFASLFKSKSQARRLQLKAELSSLRKESGEPLVKYFARAKHLKAQLLSVDTAMDEQEMCLSVLNGLPEEYSILSTVLSASDKELTLQDMLARLLIMENKVSRPAAESKAYVARPGGAPAARGQSRGSGPSRPAGKETRKCHHCGKPGHPKKDCWKRQREEQGSNDRPQGQRAQSPGWRGTQGNVACTASLEGQGQAWLLDSGASSRIAMSQTGMSNLRPAEANRYNTFGNGAQAKVEALGDLVMKVPGSEVETLTLTDVLHVPEATMNLFSIRSAVKRGVEFVFSKDKFGDYCTMSEDGRLLNRSDARGAGLFGMIGHCAHVHVALSAVESPELWHRRYGHLGYDNLAKLAAGELVTGMKTTAADFKAAGEKACGTCITSKQHKVPRPTSSSDSERPLDLVHTDVCGPLEVPSLGGCLYLATYLDDYSKMAIVKPVQRKSDVPEVTKEVINFMEKQSGCDLLVLRSDSGTENVNRDLGSYLDSKSVVHQTTARHTPEQNGAAERLNRTILERMRAMLDDSGLPKELWGEAACTAAFIRNRSPVSGRDKTPWELFFGKRPDVSTMRVFGAEAYALIPKQLRRKLDNHSELGHFVGYSTGKKTYRIALSSGEVLECADVVFVEDSSIQQPAQRPVQPDTMELDLDTVDEDSNELEPGEIEGNEEGDDPDDPEDPGPSGGQGAGQPAQTRYPNRARRQPGSWWRTHPEVAAAAVVDEPQTYEEAMSSEQADEMRQAMDDEMKSLHANQTWTTEPIPRGMRAIPVKWVYKPKKDANGNIERFKARLVAKGFGQKEGVDFDEVFAPVSKYSTLRALMAVAAVKGLEVHQLDIKTAFLNGILQEEVYVEQPAGYQEGGSDIG